MICSKYAYAPPPPPVITSEVITVTYNSSPTNNHIKINHITCCLSQHYCNQLNLYTSFWSS